MFLGFNLLNLLEFILVYYEIDFFPPQNSPMIYRSNIHCLFSIK